MENTIRVGSLITTKHKGYWRVGSITKAEGKVKSDVIHYYLVYNDKFEDVSKNSIKKYCSAHFCKLVDVEHFREKIKEKNNEIEKIIDMQFGVLGNEVSSILELSNYQINFAQRKVSEWLDIGGNTRSPADAAHSSLLFRLLSGKKALPIAPPKRGSYPWYEIGEGQKIEIEKEYIFISERTDNEGKTIVYVANSGPYLWYDKRKGILENIVTKELFSVWKEYGRRYIQKTSHVEEKHGRRSAYLNLDNCIIFNEQGIAN